VHGLLTVAVAATIWGAGSTATPYMRRITRSSAGMPTDWEDTISHAIQAHDPRRAAAGSITRQLDPGGTLPPAIPD
jgi:hypothetical protein